MPVSFNSSRIRFVTEDLNPEINDPYEGGFRFGRGGERPSAPTNVPSPNSKTAVGAGCAFQLGDPQGATQRQDGVQVLLLCWRFRRGSSRQETSAMLVHTHQNGCVGYRGWRLPNEPPEPYYSPWLPLAQRLEIRWTSFPCRR